MTKISFRPLFLACLLAPVSACVDVPALDDSLSRELRGAAYPELRPLDSVLAVPSRSSEQVTDLQEDLAQRQARLERRAAALRQAQ